MNFKIECLDQLGNFEEEELFDSLEKAKQVFYEESVPNGKAWTLEYCLDGDWISLDARVGDFL